ncbi:MAG: response regulator [Gammaproteobacteria bacterium]|nr:response regulator [Gammaproteobacteria bacterium]
MSNTQARVLFVDDQTEITDLLKKQVAGADYEAIFANSGADALSVLTTHGPFAAVIADYSMPDMDGVALLSEIKQRSPDTVLVMLTAFAELEVAVAALHRAVFSGFYANPGNGPNSSAQSTKRWNTIG